MNMPITQTTVLALYGELRAMVLLIEREAEHQLEFAAFLRPSPAYDEQMERIKAMRQAAHDAERHGIEVLMEDAPKLKINPLDGSIE
jgi:hypothetical protein